MHAIWSSFCFDISPAKSHCPMKMKMNKKNIKAFLIWLPSELKTANSYSCVCADKWTSIDRLIWFWICLFPIRYTYWSKLRTNALYKIDLTEILAKRVFVQLLNAGDNLTEMRDRKVNKSKLLSLPQITPMERRITIRLLFYQQYNSARIQHNRWCNRVHYGILFYAHLLFPCRPNKLQKFADKRIWRRY